MKNIRLALAENADSKYMLVRKDGKRDLIEDELCVMRLRNDSLHIVPNNVDLEEGGFWLRISGEQNVILILTTELCSQRKRLHKTWKSNSSC